MTDTEVDTTDASAPDNTVEVLRSWGLSGEPITWAPTRQQPVIAIIRACNTGFSDLTAVQGMLDATYPDADYDAADVALASPPTAEFTVTGDDPEVNADLTTDAGLGLPGEFVEFSFGDGTVVYGYPATHTYTEAGDYVIRCTVHVAGSAYTTTQDHEITDDAIAEAEVAATAAAEAEAEAAEEEAGPYDPGDHTVDEVLAYAAEHPDEVDDIIAAEEAGKARVGILDKL